MGAGEMRSVTMVHIPQRIAGTNRACTGPTATAPRFRRTTGAPGPPGKRASVRSARPPAARDPEYVVWSCSPGRGRPVSRTERSTRAPFQEGRAERSPGRESIGSLRCASQFDGLRREDRPIGKSAHCSAPETHLTTRSARCIFCIESGRNNGHFRPTRSIEKTRASGVSPGKDQAKSEAPPLFHISSTCGPRLRRITEIRLCVSEAGALRICSLWAPLLIKIGASV